MSRLPDLVRDSRLETRFHPKYTRHQYHESDGAHGERTVVRQEYWKRQDHLGSGSYGHVWLEKCVKGEKDYSLRAVKEIRKPASSQKPVNYYRELEAIAKFSHQRYVRCSVKSFGWYEHGSTIYIAMEYFPEGDLQRYLSASPALPESDAQSVVYQLLEGLQFLHENGFAHRDLKPGNILIKNIPPEPWWVKIGDFGISKRIEDGAGASSTLKGTLDYMAPELHGFIEQADCFVDDEHATACATDIFRDMNGLFAFVRNPNLFPFATLKSQNISDAGVSMVEGLMKSGPRHRMSAQQALAHAWTTPGRASNSRPNSVASIEISDSDEEILVKISEEYPEPSGRWSTVSMNGKPLSAQKRQEQFDSLRLSIDSGDHISQTIAKVDKTAPTDVRSSSDYGQRGVTTDSTAVKTADGDDDVHLKDGETMPERSDLASSGHTDPIIPPTTTHLIDWDTNKYSAPNELSQLTVTDITVDKIAQPSDSAAYRLAPASASSQARKDLSSSTAELAGQSSTQFETVEEFSKSRLSLKDTVEASYVRKPLPSHVNPQVLNKMDSDRGPDTSPPRITSGIEIQNTIRSQGISRYSPILPTTASSPSFPEKKSFFGRMKSRFSGAMVPDTIARPLPSTESVGEDPTSPEQAPIAFKESVEISKTSKDTVLDLVEPEPRAVNVSTSARQIQEKPTDMHYDRVCGHCQGKIGGQFVRALGDTFHPNCFTCKDCGTMVAKKFFPVDVEGGSGQIPLCETDYFRRLGLLCFKCGGCLRGSYITAANEHKYHAEHFTCSVCPSVFGSQSQYYEHEGKIYCHYHYATQFASSCKGCGIPILNQFVEIDRDGQTLVWHPQCYMIHKYWNIYLTPNDTAVTRPDIGLIVSEEQRQLARDTEEKMQEKVNNIWDILSIYEESCAFCISGMLLQISDGRLIDCLVPATNFITLIDRLFGAVESLSALNIRYSLNELVYTRETKLLCKRLVAFFTFMAKAQEKSTRHIDTTQEVLAIVTGLARYLKILIRKTLEGSLKLERERGTSEGLNTLLNTLRDIDGVKESETDLTRESLVRLADQGSDCCTYCKEPIEDECIMIYDKRWHVKRQCLLCSTCGQNLTYNLARFYNLREDKIYCIRHVPPTEQTVSNFLHVSRLQHYIFLLTVALARLLEVLKSGGAANDAPQQMLSDTQVVRDVGEAGRGELAMKKRRTREHEDIKSTDRMSLNDVVKIAAAKQANRLA